MKLDEKLVLKVLLGFFMLLSVLFLVRGCQIKDSLSDVVVSYKKTIIENDSLRKVSDGHYQKIVNDLESERSLAKLLKRENLDLYEKIKVQNKRILSLTRLSLQPKVVVDTVFIDRGGLLPVFQHFYPDEKDWFVRYRGSLLGDNRVAGVFDFQPLLIDLVVSEKQKGIYEVDLNAPTWLEVNSLRVNSLPDAYSKKDNFDWLFGGVVGLNYINLRPSLGIQAGFRYRRALFHIQGFTNNYIYIGYSRLF